MIENNQYNKLFQLLGGRKFVAVILASILSFMIIIWTFIIKNNVNAWAFVNIVIPSYFAFLAAYSGLQIWQKKSNNK